MMMVAQALDKHLVRHVCVCVVCCGVTMCCVHCVCVCAFVCVCLCICVCLCLRACVCVCVFVYMFLYVHVCFCACRCVHLCVCACVFVCACMFVCVCVWVHVRARVCDKWIVLHIPSAGAVSAVLVVDKSAIKFIRNSRAS